MGNDRDAASTLDPRAGQTASSARPECEQRRHYCRGSKPHRFCGTSQGKHTEASVEKDCDASHTDLFDPPPGRARAEGEEREVDGKRISLFCEGFYISHLNVGLSLTRVGTGIMKKKRTRRFTYKEDRQLIQMAAASATLEEAAAMFRTSIETIERKAKLLGLRFKVRADRKRLLKAKKK
jgi:hypothetical protein